MSVRIPRRSLSREAARAASARDVTSHAAVRARLLHRRAALQADPPATSAARPVGRGAAGPLRPLEGIPSRVREPRRSGAVTALAVHLLLLFLLVTPFGTSLLVREVDGAGGPGPAGGGGGGTRGSGGARERIEYVAMAAPPPPPTPSAATPAAPAATPSAAASEAAAPTPGSGGGSGNDGTAGTGPGTGGGQGSGVGTGRGTAAGPGTGGGTGTIYPPQPTELFIPPLPVPGKVKGTQLVATFDVDSTGRVLAFDFTETRDGAYNRKLREVLAGIRFRPGVNGAGTPVRAQGSVTYVF